MSDTGNMRASAFLTLVTCVLIWACADLKATVEDPPSEDAGLMESSSGTSGESSSGASSSGMSSGGSSSGSSSGVTDAGQKADAQAPDAGKDAGPAVLIARQISGGRDHMCVILDDQTVRCWGDPALTGGGPIVMGISQVMVLGTPAKPLTGVVEIAAGNLHTCALTSAGVVYCWGQNNYGSLGDGTLLPFWRRTGLFFLILAWQARRANLPQAIT
jgi:hypothetical protein